MPGGDEDGVLEGDQGSLLAAAGREASEAGGEVRVLGAGSGDGGLPEDALESRVTVACPS
ncbi:hypothetical protein OHA51_00800 [Streptomyces sp. NBC_00589]|nr:hypothetical protein [Streptomyces sp. NBC_00589]WTI42282.1 hypothetical protein OIC96_48930 [Streptomyces sp. NBC_00775]WUB24036.1 hypothetical protein OHA51_00800 [Streptomyces sp. NBC_00589]